MSNVNLNSQGDISIQGNVVGRDNNNVTINVQPPTPPSAETEIALQICLLADKFKDEFKFIRFGGVFAHEAEQLQQGEHILTARWVRAGETFRELYKLSLGAKFVLECGEALQSKVQSLFSLFDNYSREIGLYLELGREAGQYLSMGAFSPKYIEDQRMAQIEKIFGPGGDAAGLSADALVAEITHLLKSHLRGITSQQFNSSIGG